MCGNFTILYKKTVPWEQSFKTRALDDSFWFRLKPPLHFSSRIRAAVLLNMIWSLLKDGQDFYHYTPTSVILAISLFALHTGNLGQRGRAAVCPLLLEH